eukprot:6209077-Pleurochrysis_carterae.AAC.5
MLAQTCRWLKEKSDFQPFNFLATTPASHNWKLRSGQAGHKLETRVIKSQVLDAARQSTESVDALHMHRRGKALPATSKRLAARRVRAGALAAARRCARTERASSCDRTHAQTRARVCACVWR